MAIKDLFRRRSKSQTRSRSNSNGNDLSRSTTPTPSAALSNAGSSPTSNNRSPRDRASTSNLIGNAAAKNAPPYDSRPAGRPPSIGSSPLHGNASTGDDRAGARSIGTSRSMDMRRTSQGTSTTTGTTTTTNAAPSSVTTTTTTQTTTGSRPGSRQGHRHGLSVSQDLGRNTYTSREAPPQLPRIDSSSIANDHQEPSGALPIASEFSSSSWNQQHGSPSMPSYKEASPGGLDPSISAGHVPMTPTNTNIHNMHSSSGVSAIPASSTTDRQRSMSIPRKSVGDLKSGSNATTAKSQIAQSASSTSATGHKHNMSIPRKSISDMRDRNDLAMTQQKVPVREQSLGESTTRKPVPEMSWTTQSAWTGSSLGATAMGNSTAQAATTGHASSTTGYSAPQVGEIRDGRQQIYNREYLVEGASSPPSLQGVVDLTNTVDTTTHIRYAPAVLHETIRPTVHSIREEQYTREFHNYHIHQREQPIIDVQVLPPKHLVRIEDGVYKEVPAAQLPGRPESHFVIAETVSKIPGETVDRKAMGERRFTARAFGPEEGEHREYVSAAGVPTTESTWIHPPRLAQAGRVAGETVPFPMDERAEAAAFGPGWVDAEGHVVVGGGMPEAMQ